MSPGMKPGGRREGGGYCLVRAIYTGVYVQLPNGF